MKIDPYVSSFTKLKCKWINNLNIKPATPNHIEEKVGSTLECIGIGDYFLNITTAAQTLRKTINKWDLLKLKAFVKQHSQKGKKLQPTEWGKFSPTPHQTEV